MPFDYPALAALSAVLRHGSFETAAFTLNVTPSAISQRIKSLEERMGTPLVLRGAPCTGTPTGKRLARHMDDIGLLETQLQRDLGGASKTQVSVPLAVNADSLATWFIQALSPVPDLLFRIEIDDQDHCAEWLRRGEVMAAVSARATAVPGCDLHALGALRYEAVASPEFVARHFPEGLTPEALSRAPSLVFNEKDKLQDNWVRRETGQRVSLPAHRIPSTRGFVDAALAGLGWGLNPAALLKQHLDSGALVRLSPDPVDIALYWHVSRLNAPVLSAVTEAVAAAARTTLHAKENPA